MRIKILSTLLMLILTPALQAQTYTVYSVIGNARIVEGKKSTPLQARKQINSDTHLFIGTESAITLLDEKNNKMYSLSTEGTYFVSQLINKYKNKSKSITKQYMSYLVKQLFSDESQKMSHPDMYMQVTATSYRSATNDSMLLSRITQELPIGGGITAEQQLCSPDFDLKSDMDIYFELVSCDTGFSLNKQIKGNTSSYVRVHNDTEEALYVNVLDIDEDGNKYLVLPVDEAATCAHLLVPPMSTVSFKSEPFIFSDNPMKETFILVATQDPVDFSILMSPIKNGRAKPIKLGVARNFYHVQ